GWMERLGEGILRFAPNRGGADLVRLAPGRPADATLVRQDLCARCAQDRLGLVVHYLSHLLFIPTPLRVKAQLRDAVAVFEAARINLAVVVEVRQAFARTAQRDLRREVVAHAPLERGAEAGCRARHEQPHRRTRPRLKLPAAQRPGFAPALAFVGQIDVARDERVAAADTVIVPRLKPTKGWQVARHITRAEGVHQVMAERAG